MSALHQGWPTREHVAVPTTPSMTSGGKFAARAVDRSDPEPFVTLTTLPLTLPMFTAPTVPSLGTAAWQPAEAAPAAGDGVAQPPAKIIRAASHHDAKRNVTAILASQHHGNEPVIAMTPLPNLTEAATRDSSLWTHSTEAFRQLAVWGVDLVDRLIP